MVRIVIPLPGQRKGLAGAAVKFIRTDNMGQSFFGIFDVENIRGPAVDTEDRPAVFPLDGHQPGSSPDSSIILKEGGVPFALGGINQTALSNSPVLKDDSAFIRAGDFVGAVNYLRAHAAARPGDVHQIVFAVDFEHLRALGGQADIRTGHGTGVFNDDIVEAVFFYAGQIRFQFDQPNITGAINHIDASIIIKKEGVVVQRRSPGDFFPGSFFDVLCDINMGFSAGAREGRGVVGSVMIAQRTGPGAGTVGVFAVFQVHCIIFNQPIVGIADQRPVDQVFGFHNGQPRAHMHCGAAHPIGVLDADDGHVRHIRPDDRIACRLANQICRRLIEANVRPDRGAEEKSVGDGKGNHRRIGLVQQGLLLLSRQLIPERTDGLVHIHPQLNAFSSGQIDGSQLACLASFDTFDINTRFACDAANGQKIVMAFIHKQRQPCRDVVLLGDFDNNGNAVNRMTDASAQKSRIAGAGEKFGSRGQEKLAGGRINLMPSFLGLAEHKPFEGKFVLSEVVAPGKTAVKRRQAGRTNHSPFGGLGNQGDALTWRKNDGPVILGPCYRQQKGLPAHRGQTLLIRADAQKDRPPVAVRADLEVGMARAGDSAEDFRV